MKSAVALLLFLAGAAFASPAPSNSATVPITLDHDRIIVDVRLPLPDGTTKRVRAWVDNGNPDLWITENVAKLMNLPLSSETREHIGGKGRTAQAPRAVILGGMEISFAGIKEAKATAADAVGPGLSAEINLPSSVLRNYDILINYPDREFTIAAPGTLKFEGVKSKLLLNSENGLVQVPSKLENKNYNFGLDVGTPVSFLSGALLADFERAHPDWPHMTGAISIANLWGMSDEAHAQLLKAPRLQFGPVALTDVIFSTLPTDIMEFIQKRAGMETAGLLGASALINYRVGLDYKHETLYLDLRNFYKPRDMDVIGFILRPELDGRYTILGIADYDGKPSVPEAQPGDVLISSDGARATGATMGQVWSSLEGNPGQTRKLVLDRAGKQIEVDATVRHFLGDTSSDKDKKH
ncbi:MAG TPA: hypothetical protein VFA89_14545 [Terriglobales bacterium]|nr:hypothetical protein [Terriglobales bacterium]